MNNRSCEGKSKSVYLVHARFYRSLFVNMGCNYEGLYRLNKYRGVGMGSAVSIHHDVIQ